MKRKGQFWGEFGVSHCNRWGICDALFSNYFEDLFLVALIVILTECVVLSSAGVQH